MEARYRVAFWMIAVAMLVILLLRAGEVPLIDPDEPRFARTSIEMLRNGDIVVPSYEGAPRLVKPPLFHWIQAVMFRALGVSEFSARLPSVLATLGSLLILGWVVRRRFGEEGAVWAAACFATTPLVMGVGRLGNLDALLSVHVMAALALDLAEPEEAGPYRTAAIGGLLGMAFLAKGPVGVVLPVLVMLAGRTAAGRNVVPGRGALLAFAGAWCAVVLPWGLAFVMRIGLGQTLDLLRQETLVRFFAGSSHVKPPWYYAPVVLVGFVPWVAPAGVALVRLLGRRRDPAARTALYAAAGLLAGLLFFSLSRGKLPNYLAPLAPLVAILVTWELGQELDNPRERTTGPTLLAAALAAFGLVLLVAAGRYAEETYQWVGLRAAGVSFLGSLVAFVGVLRRRPRWVYGVAAVTSAGFVLLATLVLMPEIVKNRSARELITAVPELQGVRPVVIVEMHVPSLVFYLDRVPERVGAEELERRMARSDRPLFVVDPDDLPLIDPRVRHRMREIGRQGKYRVYERQPESESKTIIPGPDS